jgi:translation initiation factor 2 subunit 3
MNEINKLTKTDETNIKNIDPMYNQATINIGTIGHVSHGKSSLVRALSGVNTVKFKKEKERGITIRLGYANTKIYKCDKCPRPQCYQPMSSDSNIDDSSCKKCKIGIMKLHRHISFVDCPGHNVLMATMLNGAAVMDSALLLIAANIDCPQPQTSEHLAAMEIMNLPSLIVVQNKVDLVEQSDAEKNYNQIKKFIQGSTIESAPIIPISAQLNLNIDALCDTICNNIKIPQRDLESPPYMIIIRSFDINRPGTLIDDLCGGVIGGSLFRGILNVGDEIEIRPGIIRQTSNATLSCEPILSHIVSLHAEQNELNYAIPGGLIGVGTRIDPTLCRADRLVGQVLGKRGFLPNVYQSFIIEYFLLRYLLGSQEKIKVKKIQLNELITLNIGSTTSIGKVIELHNHTLKIQLKNPICTEPKQKASISRRINNNIRLIGWGTILSGE